MKKLRIAFILFLFAGIATLFNFTDQSKADNDYPIVFVHGLNGYGESEIPSFPYWGGRSNNVVNELNANNGGTVAYESVVSPYGSDWDRMCELYAYLKGGTVDYGLAHSQQYGHARYGRTFPGIYPQLSDTNKVHLVGHSMGGQTIRDFDSMLRNGSQTEMEASTNAGEQASPLFAGGNNWIESVTSIAGVHNGTPLTNSPINEVAAKVIFTGNLMGVSLPRDSTTLKPQATDYKLDQWGLVRKQGESLPAFNKRVVESKAWTSHDNSLYDLSINGSNAITARTNLSPNEYYFTYAGNATKQGLTGHAVPVSGIAPYFSIGAAYIGAQGNDPQWWASDGCVPVISAKAPIGQAAQPDSTTVNGPFEQSNTSTAAKGVWQYNDPVQGWDHNDFVGLDVTKDRDQANAQKVQSFYQDLYLKLKSLNA